MYYIIANMNSSFTGSSHTLPNGVDLMSESKGMTGLATEDLTDKYREAVLHYSKVPILYDINWLP